jgi:hypothetical protein
MSTEAVLKANEEADCNVSTRYSHMFHTTAYFVEIIRLSKILSTDILASADYSDHIV